MVAAREGNRVTFSVAEKVPEFVASLTARYRVRDLIVEHPPIEELVAEMYQKEGAQVSRRD